MEVYAYGMVGGIIVVGAYAVKLYWNIIKTAIQRRNCWM